MKVVGLDERTHNWNLNGYKPLKSDSRPRSRGHKEVRELLLVLFPLDTILEEVFLPGCNGTLYVDFFLPTQKTGIEVHGVQHFKFIPHFHGDMAGFMKARERDLKKSQWFDLNGFNLIVLADSETPDVWRERITRSKTEEDIGEGEGTG